MYFLKAKPEDGPMLTRIALAAKGYWGYPKAWMESWRDALTLKTAFIRTHHVYMASKEGDVVGFYALGPDGDHAQILHFWVVPGAMHRGVGRSMFIHALRRARVLGFKKVEVESDPNAEGFYQRMGARRVRTAVTELDGERRELPVLVCDVSVADTL
jgi:ribosomal protein S18 acetylase RimI-like enzyme